MRGQYVVALLQGYLAGARGLCTKPHLHDREVDRKAADRGSRLRPRQTDAQPLAPGMHPLRLLLDLFEVSRQFSSDALL